MAARLVRALRYVRSVYSCREEVTIDSIFWGVDSFSTHYCRKVVPVGDNSEKKLLPLSVPDRLAWIGKLEWSTSCSWRPARVISPRKSLLSVKGCFSQCFVMAVRIVAGVVIAILVSFSNAFHVNHSIITWAYFLSTIGLRTSCTVFWEFQE